MTREEIFSQLSAHMIKGLMIHDQLATAYGFLNLKGYQKCHEYHYFKESCDYRKLHDFYLHTFYKMIPESKIDNPEVIPANWYKYTKQEVDANTKRSAIKDMFKKWVEWETETKALLENSYKELLENRDIAAMMHVKQCLEGNARELAHAQEKMINLEMLGYDIAAILAEQDGLCEQYCNKMRDIYDTISTT